MKFDSTQSDQFDPSRTHKPHELDDERLIQDGFSKLPKPTPPTETQDKSEGVLMGVFCPVSPSPLPADEKFNFWLDDEGDYFIQLQRETGLLTHASTPEDAVWHMRELLDMAKSMPVAAPTERVETSLSDADLLVEVLRLADQDLEKWRRRCLLHEGHPEEEYKPFDYRESWMQGAIRSAKFNMARLAAVAPSPAPASQGLIQEMLAALKEARICAFGSRLMKQIDAAIANAEATNV